MEILMFEKNPMLICVSDVHLNGGNNKFAEFLQFLKEIITKIESDKKFSQKFKALIVLGDFFDMMMDGAYNLTIRNREIYEKLSKIVELGKKTIFILGNHEISVSTDYNKHFRKRKMQLISHFERVNFAPNFLKDNFVAQYISLAPNPQNKWELALYETNRIDLPAFTKLDLDEKNYGQKDYYCLMCHGYQFYKVETHFYGVFVWNSLLNAKDSTKETINFIYNESGIRELVRQGLTETSSKIRDAYNKWKEKNEKNKNFIEKVKTMNDIVFKKLFFQMVKFEVERRKFKNDDRQILKYLNDRQFQKVNHVIYGHTHVAGMTNPENKIIVNTGAWQNVEFASYAEIYDDGSIILNFMK